MKYTLTVCDWCNAETSDDHGGDFWLVTLHPINPGAVTEVKTNDGKILVGVGRNKVCRTYHCCDECARKGLVSP